MTGTISVGEQVNFSLHKALVIYESSRDMSSGSSSSWFVTEHPISLDEKGIPRIKEGALLSRDALDALVEKVKGAQAAELLPENVLVYSPNRITWWVPASVRTMYYSCERSPELRSLSGKKYPQPALLFDVCSGHLNVFALADAKRPTRATKLFRAPYWNVNDQGGVCLGSTRVPDTLCLDALPAWVDGFFLSEFTHQNTTRPLTTHPDGFAGLWRELVGKKSFPVKYLAEHSQTLGQYLAA